jgi:hypothetical protein
MVFLLKEADTNRKRRRRRRRRKKKKRERGPGVLHNISENTRTNGHFR